MTIYQIIACALIGVGFAWAGGRRWPYWIGGAAVFVAAGYGMNYAQDLQGHLYAEATIKRQNALPISNEELFGFACGVLRGHGGAAINGGCDKFKGLKTP